MYQYNYVLLLLDIFTSVRGFNFSNLKQKHCINHMHKIIVKINIKYKNGHFLYKLF